MEALKMRTHVDSDSLHISGLQGITGRDVEVIVLVEPEEGAKKKNGALKPKGRIPGSAKGLITISDDFHMPLDEEEFEAFYQ